MQGTKNAYNVRMMHARRSIADTQGFSLVELSIVLVILGLLTGGILGGQSLIRAAELRSVSTSYASYATAMQTFRDKYFALPGDMNNATKFWNSAGGTGADSTCYTAQVAGNPATCNGNGDGQIFTSAFIYSERFATWKHLANAGLVEGSYSGVTAGAAGTYTEVLGTNVPRAKLSNGFFDITYEPTNALLYAPGTRAEVNVIALYGTASSRGILKPEEAWNIDTKMDDGSPVYGKVFANKKTSATSPNCASSDADNATYDFSLTATNCSLKLAAN
ncbi:MAG: hypothetical protein DI582_03535 [Azospirillum brasilense]|nr:MAG: hypothetical protein DI582_03535 [Azospirillum brasilense]